MLRKIFSGLAIAMFISMVSVANARGFTVRAPVVDVEPIYKSVRISEPRHECRQVPAYRGGNDSFTPTIIGGIVGGVVGHQFGSGSGNTVATIAGSLLGASAGYDIGRHSQPRYYTQTEHCRVVSDSYFEERLVGYHVHYEYDSRIFTTRTKYHPGDTIKVNVKVSPRHRY